MGLPFLNESFVRIEDNAPALDIHTINSFFNDQGGSSLRHFLLEEMLLCLHLHRIWDRPQTILLCQVNSTSPKAV